MLRNTLIFFIASLISVNAIAAPKILFKSVANQHKNLSLSAMPAAITNVIQQIETQEPDLYEIVVYQFDDHYILYKLSGKLWQAERLRIDIDAARSKVINDYKLTKGEIKTLSANDATPVCPDPQVQFVAISPLPGVGLVNAAIATVSEAAKAKYKTMTILSEDADAQTYKNWLSCPHLKGFYSISHGMNDQIIVGNGEIVDSEFFADDAMKNKFKEATVVLNSCHVFNAPFGSQMTFGNAIWATQYDYAPGPNPLQFVGGVTGLLIWDSEPVTACFMVKAMSGAKMDNELLKECIGKRNIYYRDFGIANPGTYFVQ